MFGLINLCRGYDAMEKIKILGHNSISRRVRQQALQRRYERQERVIMQDVTELLHRQSQILVEQEQTIISQSKQIYALIDRVVELNRLLGRL